MLKWVIIVLIIWFVIVNPSAAAHVVHNIGNFISSVFRSA